MRRSFMLDIEMSDDTSSDERYDIYEYVRALLAYGSGGMPLIGDLSPRPSKLAGLRLSRLSPIRTHAGLYLYEKVQDE